MNNRNFKFLVLAIGFSLLAFSLIGCGHTDSVLPGSADSALTNFSEEPAVAFNEASLSPAFTSKQYDSASQKSNEGVFYASPLTKDWKNRILWNLGLSQSELTQAYQSSALSSLFLLPLEKQKNWQQYFHPLSMSSWFATKCKACLFTRNETLGTLKLYLTGEHTNPLEVGRGSSPAVAFDPVHRTYAIVWDEEGDDGRVDIFAKLMAEDGVAVRVVRKRMSVARPRHKCLFSEFAELTGLSAPNDCKRNLQPSVAYNNGKFLISWTLEGNAVAPRGHKFSAILGKLVSAENLEPVNADWNEGLLLSKITFASADPAQPARRDAELQSWSRNEHSQVISILGEGRAEGSFFLTWDTTKDFISCNDPARRRATSIYGRMIPADFSPNRDGWANNPDIFAIYTDPSTSQERCAPNEDVDRAQKPRAALLKVGEALQIVTVFEVQKNIERVVPSIGAVLVSAQNDLRTGVRNIFEFSSVDSQLNEGCYDPDVVATADRFLLVDSIGMERLKLTPLTLNRGNIIAGESSSFSPPENLHVHRPRVGTNRTFGQENDESFSLEYVVAYEAKNGGLNEQEFPIHITSFDATLHPMNPRVILEADGFSTNQHVAVASAGTKMMVVWNGVNLLENRIFDSVITVNERPEGNDAPVAVIEVDEHPEEVTQLTSGETVVLSAERSHDPEEQLLSYRWGQTEGPFGRIAVRNAVRTNFTAPVVRESTDIALELVVTDEENLSSAPARKRMRVNPPGNYAPNVRVTKVGGDGSVLGELTEVESVAEPQIDAESGLASWPRTRLALSAATSDDGENPPNSANLRFHWEQLEADANNSISEVRGMENSEFSFILPDVPMNATTDVVLRLSVNDGGLEPNTSTQDIRIHVLGVNHHPAVPILLSPENQQTVPATAFLLTWETFDPDVVVGEDTLSYEVNIFDENGFPENIAEHCLFISQSRCLVTRAAAETRYHWLVRATDGDGSQSTSAQRFFITDSSSSGIIARWVFEDGVAGLCPGVTDDEVALESRRLGRNICDISGHQWNGVFYPRDIQPDRHWIQTGDEFAGEAIQNISVMALGFDTGDSVIIPGFKLENMNQGSFGFWVYPQHFTVGENHILFQTVEGHDNLRMVIVEYDGDSGKVRLTLNTSNDDINQNQILESVEAVALNQWNHIVATFGPNGRRIFINGHLSSPPVADIVAFGEYGRGEAIFGWNSLSQGEPNISPDYLRGVLDEILIYNRELSPEVIEMLSLER